MDLNHTRLPIPPPGQYHFVLQLDVLRTEQDLIYQHLSDFTNAFYHFFQFFLHFF